MTDETGIAAAPPVETDAAPSAADVETTATETTTEEVEETPAEEIETAPEQTDTETGHEGEGEQQPKEEALDEFRGSAGARIRELCKLAPGLDKLLTQFPKAKDQIHAMARVVAAVRDQNVTVAELKEYRERLPNGLQDLNAIEQELGELGSIDSAFYGKQGEQLIRHMVEADQDAAVDLLRKAPRELARIDPDAYNEVFTGIIAATLARDRIAEVARRAWQRAKDAGDAETQNDAADLYNYLTSFGRKKTDDSPEARRLAEREERLRADTQKSRQEEGKRFADSFATESRRWQTDLIKKNPVFSKLPQAITDAKKARMAEEIRQRVVAHLQRSRNFMSQLTPAYRAMNVQKCMEIQRAGWQQWIVNKHVRDVLAEETPGIIEGTNAANAKKRAAAARTGIATRPATRPQTPAGAKAMRAEDYSTRELINGVDRNGKPIPESVIDEYLQRQRA